MASEQITELHVLDAMARAIAEQRRADDRLAGFPVPPGDEGPPLSLDRRAAEAALRAYMEYYRRAEVAALRAYREHRHGE